MEPSPHACVDSVLSRPSRVHVAGDKAVETRAISQRWRALAQGGALSVALLLQAFPGTQAQSLAPTLPGGDFQASSFQPPTTQGANQASNQVVLVNPLEGKGLDHLMADNGIEAAELLYTWRHSDITPEQGLELTKVLMATQSPTFVRDKATRQRIESLAERTSGIFHVSTRKEASEFLQEHRIEVLYDQAVIPSAWADAYSHAQVSPGALDMSNAVDLWLDSAMITHGADHEPLGIWIKTSQTPEEFQQAVASLQATVAETGLNSLRIPLSMWASADTLNRLAADLTQANLDLQRLTGWEGQVLGLKGQVNMMVGASSAKGLASFEEGHGLAVAGPLDIAEHEILIHGVGSLLAVESGMETAKGFGYSIGEAVAAEKGHLLSEGAQTWFELKANVAADMAGWRERLKQTLDSGTEPHLTDEYARYIASPEETMAFVLEVISHETLGDDSPLTHHTDGARLFSPQAEEAMQSAHRFKTAFSSLKTSWWDRLPEAGASLDTPEGTGAKPQESQPPESLQLEHSSLNAWREAREFSQAEGPRVETAPPTQNLPGP